MTNELRSASYIANGFYTSSPTVRFQTLLNVPHIMALLISLPKVYPHKKGDSFSLKKKKNLSHHLSVNSKNTI